VELTSVKRRRPKHRSIVAGKASARPELENSQDRDFLQRKFIIESHFAGRKSLL
jgi:hypothetical protein